jgi:hypothetical protein
MAALCSLRCSAWRARFFADAILAKAYPLNLDLRKIDNGEFSLNWAFFVNGKFSLPCTPRPCLPRAVFFASSRAGNV